MKTKNVRRATKGAFWELLGESDEREGCLHHRGKRTWELCDKRGDPFHPRRVIDLGQVLDRVDISWPSLQALVSQAQRIVHESEAFREDLRNALPWIPALISQMYLDSAEHRARLALLFWYVVRVLNDPLLIATQAHLERLAYHSLCDVYEAEPQESDRFQAVKQAWREAFHAWYATLSDSNRASVFEPDAPRQRETAMWEALTLQDAQGRRLRRFFRETRPGQETVRRLIEQWFLPRYDLARAERLKTAVRAASRDSETGGYLEKPAWLGARGVFISRSFTLAILVAYLLAGCQPVRNHLAPARWAPPAWLIMTAVYILCGLPPLLFWLVSGRPNTSIPRLWAGTLVAVAGTILQQNWEAMMVFAHERAIALGALCAFLLLAAYRVLLDKVRQTTGFEGVVDSGLRSLWRDPAHRRCLEVWYRGLTLAFFVSLLLTDLLGDSYLREATQHSQSPWMVWRLEGLIGHTYPALVILFTALTLFAGIFVQLLWEEKPITEALA